MDVQTEAMWAAAGIDDHGRRVVAVTFVYDLLIELEQALAEPGDIDSWWVQRYRGDEPRDVRVRPDAVTLHTLSDGRPAIAVLSFETLARDLEPGDTVMPFISGTRLYGGTVEEVRFYPGPGRTANRTPITVAKEPAC